MTKTRKILFVLFGAYLFAAMSLANAQNAPGLEGSSAKPHNGQRIQEIYQQLNLTDDQKKQLDANKQEHRAKMEAARQEVKADKEALHGELMKTQLDIPKIHQIHERIKALQSRMEDEKLNSILAVRAIFTPEQFLKFTDLMHKHQKDHDEGPSEHQEHGE
jgi:Spy/CpxP family protein refolding chaperone